MTVEMLKREALIELKQHLLCKRQYSVSYEELADADKIVSDKDVYEEFSDISFTEDDFFTAY